MECHKCKWDKEPPSDEKAKACIACSVNHTPYLSNKGQTFVSFDSGNTKGQTYAEVEESLQRAEFDASDIIGEDRGEELDAPSILFGIRIGVTRVLQYLHDIGPKDTAMLLTALYTPLAEFARLTKKTRAAVSLCWRQVVQRHPELAQIVESNITKGTSHAHAPAHTPAKGENEKKDNVEQEELGLWAAED